MFVALGELMAAAAPSAGRDELTRNPRACCVVCCSAWCLNLCCVCVRNIAAAGAAESRLYIKCSVEEHAFSPAPRNRLSQLPPRCSHFSNQTPSITQETPVIIPFPIPSFTFATLNVLVDADRWRSATAGNYRHRYYR
ncbi:hypothetical protein ACLKA7_001195 [Drosophila subpalustris]